jgi:hypothetical protein
MNHVQEQDGSTVSQELNQWVIPLDCELLDFRLTIDDQKSTVDGLKLLGQAQLHILSTLPSDLHVVKNSGSLGDSERSSDAKFKVSFDHHQQKPSLLTGRIVTCAGCH